MTADELVESLRVWLAKQPTTRSERDLQEAVEEKLRGLGRSISPQHKIPNRGAGGASRIDVFVTDTDPPLLIELKDSGDWRAAVQAAWQLFQAGELLADSNPRKLAILGTPMSDPLLRRMFDKLGVESASVGA